jgi:hypothetical protein
MTLAHAAGPRAGHRGDGRHHLALVKRLFLASGVIVGVAYRAWVYRQQWRELFLDFFPIDLTVGSVAFTVEVGRYALPICHVSWNFQWG